MYAQVERVVYTFMDEKFPAYGACGVAFYLLIFPFCVFSFLASESCEQCLHALQEEEALRDVLEKSGMIDPMTFD